MFFRRKKTQAARNTNGHLMRGREAAGRNGPSDSGENPLARRLRATEEPATVDLAATAADRQAGADEPGTCDLAAGDEPDDTAAACEPVTGFLVVVDGPGRGNFAPVYRGMNSLGRMPTQRIRLDYGDELIAPENHCQVIYDALSRRFFVQQGTESNATLVSGSAVLAPVQLQAGGELRVGGTVLRFLPLCGETFDWDADASERA